MKQSAPQANGEPCSLARRLAAMLYDGFIVIALLMLATMLAMALGFRELSAVDDPLYAFFLLLVWYGYLGWFWRHGGMTVGMRTWRVRIEGRNGEPPGRGSCLLRFAMSFVSAGAAGLGFAWSLLDSEKRCWHDRVSKTRLLRN